MTDRPIDYPIGKLLKKLPKDVQAWILAQNMEAKTTSELRELLRWGRRNFKLPPWSVFTAIMQAYAAAAHVKEGGKSSDYSWFFNTPARSLDIYEHDYENAHEVWVNKYGGNAVFVGWLVCRFDGRDVFSFWNERTERYYMDCTRFLKILDPVTQELLLTNHGLAKWRDYWSLDGRVFLPQAKRRVRMKHKDEQPELPMRTSTRPSVQTLETRLKILLMFQSVLNPEAMAIFVADNPGMKDLYAELCGVLRSSLDIYVNRLKNHEVTNIHIPDDVILACESLIQLYASPQGIVNSIKFWLDELLKTDTRRLS